MLRLVDINVSVAFNFTAEDLRTLKIGAECPSETSVNIYISIYDH
jgi:hypothetical protein